MLIINDTHLGVHRTGGTTPLSYAMLDNYTMDCFEQLLDQAEADPDKKVLINGDLFDGFVVSNNVLVRAFEAIQSRMVDGRISCVTLSRGNHDISKNSEKLSSFDVLGHMLQAACNGFDSGYVAVEVITEPTKIRWDEGNGGVGIVLPHLQNQDLFDVAIDDICADPRPFLFVHANYDNGFAEEADHSLNLSKQQAQRLNEAGVRHIIFAHEHQQRQEAFGVVVVGNQFPTSVSDCLNNSTKRMLQIVGSEIHSLDTWEEKGSYMEVDWHKLGTVPNEINFMRVKGEATAEEAADVLAAVSALRKTHNAFVITNAVEVDGRSMDVSALEAVENVQRFDVLHFLKDNLTPEQAAAVDAIVATRKETEDV
jgi:DNA repair exonuclease SbcCD nuclease subunit